MNAILALRMERQHLTRPASREEYDELYRDLQPGYNVYWNGFGQPPVLSFRADFDDIEYNRRRQLNRDLIKGRFAGGNLGWIVEEDLPLFAALYRKPIKQFTLAQEMIMRLIDQLGPLNIQQLKEETGLLVKEITPALHRLQEAFLLYEDQYDGEWDRGWYRLEEMFPEADWNRYTRHEALKIVLQRFARRMVFFDSAMAKGFYKLPEKDIRAAAGELVAEGIFILRDKGWMLSADADLFAHYTPAQPRFVHAIHRNDVLYKAHEPELKALIATLCEGLPYDHEPLQYLLIDGKFRGASVGHFRNGPYDLNDVVCDLLDAAERREEIIAAIREANYGHEPLRFMGQALHSAE